jgi:ATP-dependent DNA helicase PIF1
MSDPWGMDVIDYDPALDPNPVMADLDMKAEGEREMGPEELLAALGAHFAQPPISPLAIAPPVDDMGDIEDRMLVGSPIRDADLDAAERKNYVLAFAADQATGLRRFINYYRGPNNRDHQVLRTRDGQFSEGNEEAILGIAAREATRKVRRMFADTGHDAYYLHVILGFADGNWRTVTHPGAIEMSEYDNWDGTYDWQRIQEDILQSLLTFWARMMSKYLQDDSIGGGLVNWVIGVHSPPPARLGCSKARNYQKTVTFVNADGATCTVKCWNFKVQNNNCGLKCLFMFYKMHCAKDKVLCDPPMPTFYEPKKKKNIPVSIKKLKKDLGLREDALMGKEHFAIVAKKLSFHIVCRDTSWNLMWEVNPDCQRKVTLMNDKGHSLLCVKEPVFKRQKRKCNKSCDRCGKKRVKIDHRCGGVKRQRVTVEEFKQNLATESKELQVFYQEVKHLRSHWMVQGPGGTGKSYMIQRVQDILDEADTRHVTLSPTGVAAIGIDGSTINSYFKLGVMAEKPDKILAKIIKDLKRCEEIKALELMILDEVSMIPVDVFYMASQICKRVRLNDKPFGGIRLILSGDFLQLPPVTKHGEQMRFIFETELFQEIQRSNLRVLNLTQGYRFKDNKKWYEQLTRYRKNDFTLSDFHILENRIKTQAQIDKEITYRNLKPTYVYGKRKKVRNINRNCLNNTFGPVTEFKIKGGKPFGYLTGKSLTRVLTELSMTENLQLKVGSEVMYISNNLLISHGIGNGSRGTVTAIKDTRMNMRNIVDYEITVDFESVGPVVIRHEYHHSTDSFYYPLILAHAITTHKCQSKTISTVVTELSIGRGGQIWEGSQAYVVLSRVPSIKNLFILKPHCDINAFFVNPRAHSFTTWCENWEAGKYWKVSNPLFYLDNMIYPEIRNLRDVTSSSLKFRMKSPTPKKLLRNIIFYDYETYWDKAIGKEEPYYNHLIYFRDGKKVMEVSQCMICDEKKDIRDESFKLIMKILLESCDRAKFFRDNPQLKKKEEPLYLCAYNGSGFDWHFIMQKLISSHHADQFRPHITMKGTKIVCMSFYDIHNNRIALFGHDMYNILGPSSLANAAKDFLGKMTKDYFPHDWVTLKRLQNLTPSTLVNVPITDFPSKTRRDVLKSGMDIKQFHFDKVLHTYGKKDVDVLVAIYKSVEVLSQEILLTSILRFSTTSKMTWYGFLRYIPSHQLQQRAHGKNDRTLRVTKIYRMTRNEDNDVTQSVFGGKVFPRFTDWKSSQYKDNYECIFDAYVDLDVKSMYVSIMMEKDFPYGLHQFHDANSDRVAQMNISIRQGHERMHPERNKFFIAYVDCQPHPMEMEPCIGRKEVDKNGKQKGRLIWDNKRRTGWYTNIDLWLLMKNEGKIHKVFKMYEWPEKSKLFSKWITKTFKGKEEAAKAGLKAKKSFYKTLGNACYGSSLQRVFDDIVRHVVTPEDLQDFHYKYDFEETVNFDEVLRDKHRMLILKGKNKVNPDFEYTERPRFLGAFILSYTRVLYDSFYSVINPDRRKGNMASVLQQILYGDTDSMLVHYRSIPALVKAGMIGNSPGKLTDDLSDDWFREDGNHQFAKIIDYVGPAGKSYGLRAVHPPALRAKILKDGFNVSGNVWEYSGSTFELNANQVVEDLTKFKGISKDGYYYDLDGVRYRSLSLPMIRRVLAAREEGKKITVVMPKRLRRNGLNRSVAERSRGKPLYNIERKDLERGLFVSSFTSRKRTIKANITVPHYFDELALRRINMHLAHQ